MQLNQLQQETASAFKELQATNEKGQLDVLDKQKLSNLNQSLDSLSLMFDKYLKSQQSPSYQQKAGLTLTTQDQAFQNSGVVSQFNEMVRSDSVASTDVGYLQSARVNEMIKNYLNANSVIRKFANQVAISRESLEYVRNKLDIQAQWNGGTLPPDSVDGYEKFTIKLNDLIAQPKVTYNLINDVQIDFEAWLANELGQIFLNKENDAFINGDGVNKPNGILSYASTLDTVTTKNASLMTVDGIINLVYSMSDIYANDAVIIMNKATVQEVRKLKDSNGQYLWMPGILSGKSDTIMGVPLQTMSNIPLIAANSICAIYANLKKSYLIADHENIAIQKDPFSAKPFISFYCGKRVGGDVINPKAIKLLKVAV